MSVEDIVRISDVEFKSPFDLNLSMYYETCDKSWNILWKRGHKEKKKRRNYNETIPVCENVFDIIIFVLQMFVAEIILCLTRTFTHDRQKLFVQVSMPDVDYAFIHEIFTKNALQMCCIYVRKFYHIVMNNFVSWHWWCIIIYTYNTHLIAVKIGSKLKHFSEIVPFYILCRLCIRGK